MSTDSTAALDWEGTPLVVKPRVVWRLLACSNTRGYELLAAGELQSFKDGRSRKSLSSQSADPRLYQTAISAHR